MSMPAATATWIGIVFCVEMISGFYLPGMKPIDYFKSEALFVKTDSITSVVTQLPFDYYSLPFCRPFSHLDYVPLNLGELLHGSRIYYTPYIFRVAEDSMCNVLCAAKYNSEQLKEFKLFIDGQYIINLLLDNLPVAVKSYEIVEGLEKKIYSIGYPVGNFSASEDGSQRTYTLNNHLRFSVLFNRDYERDIYRIIGFEVEPFSVRHRLALEDSMDEKPILDDCVLNWGNRSYCALSTCNKEISVSEIQDPLIIDDEAEETFVIWSYDVIWKPSTIHWGSRWDTYLYAKPGDHDVHTIAVINGICCVLLLTGIVAFIMNRTLQADFLFYSKIDLEASNPIGWKALSADVFRPPSIPNVLAVLAASGVQVFLMTGILLCFALFGFMSPDSRGLLLQSFIGIFIFLGSVSGFVGGILSKIMHVENWKKVSIMISLLIPGVSFVVMMILNAVAWRNNSTNALPFRHIVELVSLWALLSPLLIFVGGYVASITDVSKLPAFTSQPKDIPPSLMGNFFVPFCFGLFPFLAVVVEISIIFASIWLHQVMYLFGYVFVVFLLLAIVSAEVSIVFCYFLLCAENYRWWWRSFLSTASSGLYLFLYAVYCLMFQKSYIAVVYYIGYTFLGSFLFSLATGAVGFCSSLFFVIKIYSTAKMD